MYYFRFCMVKSASAASISYGSSAQRSSEENVMQQETNGDALLTKSAVTNPGAFVKTHFVTPYTEVSRSS